MNRHVLYLIQSWYALPRRTWEARGYPEHGYTVPLGKK